MFFLFPLGLGATIFVLSCVGAVAFFSIFPLWFGVFLGAILLGLHNVLLSVVNMVGLAIVFLAVPTLLFGGIITTLSGCEKFKDKLLLMVLSAIFALPPVSLVTYIIFDKWLDPLEHWGKFVDSRSPDVMWSQIADQSAKCDTYVPALRLISDTLDYSLIALILLLIFGYSYTKLHADK